MSRSCAGHLDESVEREFPGFARCARVLSGIGRAVGAVQSCPHHHPQPVRRHRGVDAPVVVPALDGRREDPIGLVLVVARVLVRNPPGQQVERVEQLADDASEGLCACSLAWSRAFDRRAISRVDVLGDRRAQSRSIREVPMQSAARDPGRICNLAEARRGIGAEDADAGEQDRLTSAFAWRGPDGLWTGGHDASVGVRSSVELNVCPEIGQCCPISDRARSAACVRSPINL